jgi:hypothetical protein
MDRTAASELSELMIVDRIFASADAAEVDLLLAMQSIAPVKSGQGPRGSHDRASPLSESYAKVS